MGAPCALCCSSGIGLLLRPDLQRVRAWRCAVHMQLQGETRQLCMCDGLSGVDWSE